MRPLWNSLYAVHHSLGHLNYDEAFSECFESSNMQSSDEKIDFVFSRFSMQYSSAR